MAVAHASLVMADYMLSRKAPCREAGADYFDKRRPEDVAQRLVKRLQTLGYDAALSRLVARPPGYFQVSLGTRIIPKKEAA